MRAGGRTPQRAELEPLLLLLAPFAPHVAEELYQRLGHNDGLFDSARWPTFDPAKTVEESVEIAVQVNGKLRARLVVAVGATQAVVQEMAQQLDNVARHVEGKTVRKTIFVPGKLLNLVVG